MSSLEERIKLVRARIEGAAARSNRSAGGVTLVAVSKGMPASLVREARELGISDFGENRVQEARQKIPEARVDAVWHLIGQLQANKAKHAVTMFSLIHSLDRPELAVEIERQCDRFDVTCNALIQVNIAKEETKAGIDVEELPALVSELKSLERINILGLMTIAPYVSDPEEVRPVFRALAGIREQLKQECHPRMPMNHLSMGMSGDFEVAIEEGATIVRVGSAIFGPRPPRITV